MQIWDTAGQERFQSIGQSFYRGAEGCVLTFDLTNQDSFEAMEHWYEEFCQQSNIATQGAMQKIRFLFELCRASYSPDLPTKSTVLLCATSRLPIPPHW
jgi:GTPase SAR1 family protein